MIGRGPYASEPVSLTTRALGASVTVRAPQSLAERLRLELASLWDSSAASDSTSDSALGVDILLELGESGRSRVDPATPASTPAAGHDIDPVQIALTEITRAAIGASPMLCVHAGVVTNQPGTSAIAIPGASGRGKTTLIAALVQRGFGYVSDEALVIDRETGRLAAFPRPLALDRTSWELLSLPTRRRPRPHAEQLAGPIDFGLGTFISIADEIAPLRDIVLFQRSGTGVTFEEVSRGAAVVALVDNAFNHFADASASFHAIVALARGARVWRLTYSHAPDAASALADRLLTS